MNTEVKNDKTNNEKLEKLIGVPFVATVIKTGTYYSKFKNKNENWYLLSVSTLKSNFKYDHYVLASNAMARKLDKVIEKYPLNKYNVVINSNGLERKEYNGFKYIDFGNFTPIVSPKR